MIPFSNHFEYPVHRLTGRLVAPTAGAWRLGNGRIRQYRPANLVHPLVCPIGIRKRTPQC